MTAPKTSARQLADQLAENLAGHYARLIHHWDGDATTEFTARLRALTHLCRDICALRKSEHQAALIKLAEAKHALRQRKFAAETEAAFLKRLDQPGMRERILHHYNNTPSPSPAPSRETPDARAETPDPIHSAPIKPNQALSGVGTTRPQIEPSAVPASRETSAQSQEPRAHSPASSPPSRESHPIKPNQAISGVGKVSCNLLPGDYPDPGPDAPDIYSIPNPAIAARKPKKEEPIVRGFVSMVNYGPSERRNDVHY